MTAIQKLEKRLSELPSPRREEVAALLLEELDAQEWDRQLEADAGAGKLDEMIERAKRAYRDGEATPLT